MAESRKMVCRQISEHIHQPGTPANKFDANFSDGESFFNIVTNNPSEFTVGSSYEVTIG